MLTILQCFDNSVCVFNRLCFESSEGETNMKGRRGGKVKGNRSGGRMKVMLGDKDGGKDTRSIMAFLI